MEDGQSSSSGGVDMAVESGSVYFWGFDSLGQGVNKNGNRGKDVHLPIEIKGLKNIVQVSCGAFFFAALNTSGKVFSWGCGKKGRLGNGKEEDNPVPSMIKGGLSKVHILKISCGSNHTAALSDAGDLFTWGSNSRGELGLIEASDCLVPQKVTTFPLGVLARDVSCGHQFTAVISHSHSLFTFGSNNSGQLALGIKKKELSVHIPTQVSITNESGEEAFIQVASVCAGHEILAVVSLVGVVYISGHNTYNIIPSCKEKVSFHLVPIPLPDEAVAKHVSCNKGQFYASVTAISTTGKLYSWGSNYKGKLATGDFDDKKLPTQVSPAICRVPIDQQSASGSSSGSKISKEKSEGKTQEKVLGEIVYQQISLGGIHGCAVDVNNNLYSFGALEIDPAE
eukprot:TRINITY_DN16819_c0_g1_i1.p1 TRINITY_DN16819_c0_g1~~TRINITY_DN16819_c0_g1_i1.p1  ORF type:complete len:396 (-),score=95.53 TRINITY_DN16819_c0_g1_i1:422-1609(-)